MKNSNVDLTFVMKYIQKDKNFKMKAKKKIKFRPKLHDETYKLLTRTHCAQHKGFRA
jgi:hypothetical protein